MARTSIKLYASSFVQVSSDNPTETIAAVTDGPNKLSSWGDRAYGIRMLFKISSPGTTLGFKRLYEAKACFACCQPAGGRIFPLKGTYNASTVTWETMPSQFGSADDVQALFAATSGTTKTDKTFSQTVVSTSSLSRTAKAYLENRAAVTMGSSNGYSYWVWTTLVNNTQPYIEIFYDDSATVSSQITYKSGPTSGTVSPASAISFSWTFERVGDYYCANSFSQASAVFHWKKSTDGSYTDVSISSSTKSVTIPANTFPTSSTIQWYVTGTDNSGATTQTSVYSFKTSGGTPGPTPAGTAYATAQSPINTVEDGSAPITFTWTLRTTDSRAISAVDLCWKLPSEDDSSWHDLLNHGSPVTSYDAEIGTFPAGEIQWKVRAYNSDNVAGPWSTPASGYYSFICVAAPDPVEDLSATSVPLTTVTWSSTAQQAYEISIDGEVVYKGFGVESSWTAQEPLADGSHEISIRVQGQYGFWSQPSTTAVSITNDPQNSITLNGHFQIDADLSWTFGSSPSDSEVWLYRDGIRIGKTSLQAFVDRSVLGKHSYYIILPDSSGNYSQSNTVTGTMCTDRKRIAALDETGPWLELRLSENSADLDDFQWSRTQIVQHVTGARYPETELSSFEDLNATYNCAFRCQQQAAAFEALRGKTVIVKSRGGNVVTGVLSQLSKQRNVFYTAYSFTITQIHVPD